MYSYDFRATGFPFRLYSGKNALEKLPDEVSRNRAKRAFVVCGRTVSRKTPLIGRMRELLDGSLAMKSTRTLRSRPSRVRPMRRARPARIW